MCLNRFPTVLPHLFLVPTSRIVRGQPRSFAFSFPRRLRRASPRHTYVGMYLYVVQSRLAVWRVSSWLIQAPSDSLDKVSKLLRGLQSTCCKCHLVGHIMTSESPKAPRNISPINLFSESVSGYYMMNFGATREQKRDNEIRISVAVV